MDKHIRVSAGASYLTRFGAKLEALLFLLLCISLIWVPLPGASNRNWSMMGWSAFIFSLTSFWFFIYAVGAVELWSRLKKSWASICYLLLVQLWIFIQWYQATGWTFDRSASFYALILGLAYSCLFMLLLQLLNHSRGKRLLVIIFASAVAQALYGVMMVLSDLEMGFLVEKLYFKNQATGTFINPNHFAAYLVIGLSIGIAALMVKTKDLSGRENILSRSLQVMMSGSIAWRLALIVLVVGLVMSSSRMGNIAFFAGLFAASGFYMWVKQTVGVDFYRHVRNDYIEFLIEPGLIGLIPLAVVALLSIRVSYLALKSWNTWAQIAGYAAFMSIIAIAVHSTADFSLRIPAYGATLMAVLAVAYSEAFAHGSGRRRRRRRKSSRKKASTAESAWIP